MAQECNQSPCMGAAETLARFGVLQPGKKNIYIYINKPFKPLEQVNLPEPMSFLGAIDGDYAQGVDTSGR